MNYITGKHLSRRTFLKGSGAAMGLPVLDAMYSPLTAVAQTMKKAPVRLGYVYTPNGIIGCNSRMSTSSACASTRCAV